MDLTPEERAEADRIFEDLRSAVETYLRALAELLASKSGGDLFGRTEHEVRDRVHQIGAKAIESALAGRKKGATKAAASPARPATTPRSSNATKPDVP